MSLFSHAGVSTLNGETKVRFANDSLRVKVLAKNGHRDIDMVELKQPMTKEEAVAFLLSIDFDNGNKTVRAALEDYTNKRSSEPKAKAPKLAPAKKRSVKADVEQAIGLSEAKAQLKAKVEAVVAIQESEDAPF
jgi:hypothetical protein